MRVWSRLKFDRVVGETGARPGKGRRRLMLYIGSSAHGFWCWRGSPCNSNTKAIKMKPVF